MTYIVEGKNFFITFDYSFCREGEDLGKFKPPWLLFLNLPTIAYGIVQKLSFNSSTKSAGSDSGRSSLKSSPSTRPILFGTPKSLSSSPLQKRTYKVIDENDEDDDDSAFELPGIKQRKHIPTSSHTLSPIAPSTPALSEGTISKDQDTIEEVDLRSNTKAGSKTVLRPSRKSRPSQKIIENTLVE